MNIVEWSIVRIVQIIHRYYADIILFIILLLVEVRSKPPDYSPVVLYLLRCNLKNMSCNFKSVGVVMTLVYVFACAFALRANDDSMPLPFTRELYVNTPAMSGSDVLIMCTLLSRDVAVQATASEGFNFENNRNLHVSKI